MTVPQKHKCVDCDSPLSRYEDMIYCKPCQMWVTEPLEELREDMCGPECLPVSRGNQSRTTSFPGYLGGKDN